MILMIDNYDSSVYNLVQYFKELDEDIAVKRNNEITIDDIKTLNPEIIVLSPGSYSSTEARNGHEILKNFITLARKRIKEKDSEINPLEYLEEELKNYQGENDNDLPFVGEAVSDTYIATPNLEKEREESLIDEIENKIKNAEQKGIDPICNETKNIKPIKLQSNFTKKGFEDTVQKVRNYIRSGDICKANLTQRFTGQTSLSSYELYRDLRRFFIEQFGAFSNFDKSQVVSICQN